MTTQPTKPCSKCGDILPATPEYFHRKRTGLRSICKPCARSTARAHYEGNKEQKAATVKAWREVNKERTAANSRTWHEANKERLAAYRESNKERRAANSRTWYESNKERRVATIRAWDKANPDKVHANRRCRRAREAGAEGMHTAEDIRHLYDEQGGCCAYCEQALTWENKTVDHVIPLIRGGSDWPSNLVISCGRCNYSKGSKLLEEWESSS